MTNLKEIKKQIKDNLIDKVNDVLNGDEHNVQIHYARPNDVIEYLESLDDDKDIDVDFNSNSWTWDYWLTFSFNDKNYQISGDGYYTDSLNFSLNDGI